MLLIMSFHLLDLVFKTYGQVVMQVFVHVDWGSRQIRERCMIVNTIFPITFVIWDQSTLIKLNPPSWLIKPVFVVFLASSFQTWWVLERALLEFPLDREITLAKHIWRHAYTWRLHEGLNFIVIGTSISLRNVFKNLFVIIIDISSVLEIRDMSRCFLNRINISVRYDLGAWSFDLRASNV